VPAPGQTVILKRAANLSVGGTAVDVTDRLHPSVRWACERAAVVVGLDVCGVDLVTSDAARPLDGGVVEVNASPGLRMHVSRSDGEAGHVDEARVSHRLPPGSEARVPIGAITGTNGETRGARLVGHLLGEAGEHVGITTADLVYAGGDLVRPGDITGPLSARA